MPQSSSEQSLVTNIYPVLMGKSDILVKDDFGHTNPLEVGDYTHHHNNRELVNLENASVNIDNSSDVIIGPVTQFNVNGNVTIYQNENGPTSTDGGGDNQDEKTNSYDDCTGQKQKNHGSWIIEIRRVFSGRRHLIWICSTLSVAVIILLAIAVIFIRKWAHHVVQYDDKFSDPIYGSHLGNHSIFYRRDWGGLPPKVDIVYLRHPVPLLIISHSATKPCYSLNFCSKRMNWLQKDHQTTVNDIGMNFAIGGDGNIYVGRGWDIENYRRKSTVLIAFIGDYIYDTLTENMLDAAQRLIAQGVELGKLSNDYGMVGENQTTPSRFLSPGDNVYKIIKSWPHFINKTMF